LTLSAPLRSGIISNKQVRPKLSHAPLSTISLALV
jgi:hypothetical protein